MNIDALKEKMIKVQSDRCVENLPDTRNISMDTLRVVACIMVIFLHVLSEKIYNPWDSDMKYAVVMQCIFQPAVPIFFMLSGAFSNRTEISHYLRKIFKLLSIYVVFKIIYALWDCFFENGFIALYLLNWDYGITDLKTFHFHLWYLFVFSNILLVAPIINSAVKNNKSLIYYLSALFFIICIIRPMLKPILIHDNVNANFVQMLLSLVELDFSVDLGYFCFGKAIHSLFQSKKDIWKDTDRLPVMLSVFLLAWVCVVAYNSFAFATDFSKNDMLDYDLLNRSNPAIFLSALLIFSVFELIDLLVQKNSSINNRRLHRYSKVIELIVSCTMGIYIIHPIFINLVTRFLGLTANSFNPVGSVTVKVCIVFVSCLLCVVIFNYLKAKIMNIHCTEK